MPSAMCGPGSDRRCGPVRLTLQVQDRAVLVQATG
jgi:hypothetical protein